MKISASIYSWKRSIEETLAIFATNLVDYVHVDCRDDMSVFDDIETMRAHSKIPIDLHIITDEPEKYYQPIRDHKLELVSFQHEDLPDGWAPPKDLGCRLGLSVLTGTNVEHAVGPHEDDYSFVMFMTTIPGVSGGTFNDTTYDEIRNARKLFPSKAIHVDGGVNDEIGFTLKMLNVACVVTGSYLAKAETPGAGILAMRTGTDGATVALRNVMMRPNELPSVPQAELTMERLLSTIDRGKRGFALVTGENGALEGVVSDGDVRRGLLRSYTDGTQMTPEGIINRSYFSMSKDDTVGDMMAKTGQMEIPVQFIPVLDTDGSLAGAVSLASLLKGEL